MDRPAFVPSVYETPELAELNRPIHPLAWDMIEAEQALRSIPIDQPEDYKAQLEVVLAARKAHSDAVDALDIEIEAYCARRDAEANIPELDSEDQLHLI